METNDKKRVIFLNDDARNSKYPYKSNYIKTTKYSIITFLPASLLLQFLRVANIYFLIIAILQAIPAISPLSPYTGVLPLLFVLTVSVVREGIEDFRRYRSDRSINNAMFDKLESKGKFQSIMSRDIKVGDILLVNEDDTFPADLILLKSSLGQNAFIQTSSLDGEKNLKKRTIPVNFEEYVKPIDEKDFHLVGKCVSEPPNMDLYNFTGKMVIGSEQFALNVKQLLLKGSNLKNTEWILGLVVFTGKDTRLMMNSQKSRTKQSKVEKKLNYIIFFILMSQIAICFTLCVIMFIRDSMDDANQDYYVGAGNSDEDYILNFFTYFLLLNTMIPISLIVTLEVIKVLQCIFIMWDSAMFSIDDNARCHVSSTTINEELGQVKYIFSDKTGTLTQNIMVFKALWVEKQLYGSIGDQIQRKPSKLEQETEIEYTFKSHKLDLILDPDIDSQGSPLRIVSSNRKESYMLKDNREKAIEAMKLLAIWHECVPEFKIVDEEHQLFYQGPSPDETTLVDFAQKQGFEFIETSETHVKIHYFQDSGLTDDPEGVVKTYNIHRRMEFSSDRKRMGVLFTDPDDGKIKLFMKGADSEIKSRLSPDLIDDETNDYIDDFLARSSVKGLRTLLLGIKVLDESEFQEIKREFENAEDDIENRDTLLEECFDRFERDLILIGATAVEDRLQEDVPEILEDFRKANIKVWMLTGDKLETAKNIGYSCKLLTDDMVVFQAKGKEQAESVFNQKLEEDNESMMREMKKRAVVIDADAFSYLWLNPYSLRSFITVAKSCNAVICSRVSPAQKAEVVRLIKKDDKKNITLSIGDGANDVSMILEADIGIGIYGKEGVRAAQASDFAIHKFKYLWQLVLFHGRYNYIRITELILYFFYKNIIFTIPQVFFAFINEFSGQSYFDDYYISFYNLFFTALPIWSKALFEMDINYKMEKDGANANKIKGLYPYLYYVGQRSLIFTNRNYIIWTGTGILQSLMIFLVNYFTFKDAILSKDGYNGDMWLWSITSFTSIIIIVNLKILITHRWLNIFNLLNIFVMSILLYYVYTWIANYIPFSRTYMTSEMLHSTPLFYLSVLFWVGIAFWIDYFVEAVKMHFLGRPTAFVRIEVNENGCLTPEKEEIFKRLCDKKDEQFMKKDLSRAQNAQVALDSYVKGMLSIKSIFSI